MQSLRVMVNGAAPVSPFISQTYICFLLGTQCHREVLIECIYCILKDGTSLFHRVASKRVLQPRLQMAIAGLVRPVPSGWWAVQDVVMIPLHSSFSVKSGT